MLIERPDDMSRDGRLAVCRDSEGDFHIRVIPPAERSDDYAPSVEFVAHCSRSPRTVAALEALIEAMRLDNEERPLPGQFTDTE
ncbi:hypothetical protein EGJ28_16475 [Stutzerimonas xanthomarina]|jgi:hypothetical protein|uniref:Uncharacterized protein n=1 Tax=Stutzerimonas xanthomarina TaxID=271420 RepID=A0A3R8VT80_9GAMM|nr:MULTISPECIES: hypothetical protein [Stutzerimonas]KIL03183.1 hypothetical protein QX25_18560 [Stutzerimonas stutzeri]MBK3920000.1 hypothetical protein [Stutzerimonas frequens]RRV08859.1 hypothetical protein EGJ28_16475 [Stutzerimonas xanthomarina]